MTTPSFAQPGQGGDKFEPTTWAGALLLVYPHKYVTGITTKFGDADAVEADVIVLDRQGPDGQPVKLTGTMIFQGVMVGQTKGSIGGMVLGRLGQGANTKGNPPWLLLDHTPQDAQTATAYIASHPAVSQPSGSSSNAWDTQNSATPAPAAAADPWAVAPGHPEQQFPTPAPATPAPAGPPAASALDPQLVAFLKSKGVDATGMTDATARMVAATFS